MWEFLKQNQFVLGALTGSLSAYLLGLVVSHLRRERRWLGHTTTRRNVVSRGHTKLLMSYDDKAIERLDSYTVTLRNVGNRALSNQPVCIELEGPGSILDCDEVAPRGATSSLLREHSNKLVITTDLLNPGELVTVDVTVADGEDSKISVVARGELLELRELRPDRDPFEAFEVIAQHSPPFLGQWFRLFVAIGRRTQRR